MSLAHVNRRIKAKLTELHKDAAAQEARRKLVHRKNARVDEIVDALEPARRHVRRLRAEIDGLRSDFKELKASSPGEWTPEEKEVWHRLDELSGMYEEAVSIRDRLLDKLDIQKDKLAEAKRELQKAVDESSEDREALIRLRARRYRIKSRRDKPSEHFAFSEFDCNDGTPLPKQSEPAVKDWCVRIGEKVRERFGSVHINSGFRHQAYNARIGGEPNSVHIYDYPGRDYKAVAVDFTAERGTPREWFDFTAGLADGRGLYQSFHHADTRNRIQWPDATWSG